LGAPPRAHAGLAELRPPHSPISNRRLRRRSAAAIAAARAARAGCRSRAGAAVKTTGKVKFFNDTKGWIVEAGAKWCLSWALSHFQ